MYSLNELARRINTTAQSKGWWFGETSETELNGHPVVCTVPRSPGTVLALVHSEVSEALEEWRDGNALNRIYWTFKTTPSSNAFVEVVPSNQLKPLRLVTLNGSFGIELPRDIELLRKNGIEANPEGVPIELADTLIRVFDACHEWGIDIEEAMRIKMDFNETRPHRHGGKRA